jgi:brefeldin A-inhibited guanine nucleotide-exchange protein
MNSKEPQALPDDFEFLETNRGKPVNFNRGGKSVYMCYKRSDVDVALASIALVLEFKDEEAPLGFSLLEKSSQNEAADLRAGRAGQTTFFALARSDLCPIINLQCSNSLNREEVPENYHCLLRTAGGRSAELNVSGQPGYLCFQVNSPSLVEKALNFAESFPTAKPFLAAAAILALGLYSPKEQIVLKVLSLIRKLEFRSKISIPEAGINFLLRVLVTAQYLYIVCFSETVAKTSLFLIRDLLCSRVKDVDVEVAIMCYRVFFLYRSEDRREHFLEGLIDFYASLCKETLSPRWKKRQKAFEFSPLSDDSNSIVKEILIGIVSHVDFVKTHEDKFNSFQRHRFVTDRFIHDIVLLVRALFRNSCSSHFAAAFLVCAKLLTDSVDRSRTAHVEQLKRKIHASRMIQRFLTAGNDFFSHSTAGNLLVRRCLINSVLEAIVTVTPGVFQQNLRTLHILWKEFRLFCKQELAVSLDLLIFKMLMSPHCSSDQKRDILESLTFWIQNCDTLMHFFYNYDILVPERKLFSRLIQILSDAVRGKSLNVLDPSDSALQALASTFFVNILQYLSKRVIKQVEEYSNSAIERKKSLSDLMVAFERELSPPKSSTSMSHGSIEADSFDDSTDHGSAKEKKILAKTSESWASLLEHTQSSDIVYQQALDIASRASDGEGVKKAIKFLLENRAHRPTAKEIASFLRSSCLKPQEIGDFLGSDFSKQFSTEEFISIRHHYMKHLDFTSLSFDQALRLLLVKGGFRLPGESQKIDKIMEAFADAYCRDNPGVFVSSEGPLILAFALIMVNTDLHDPRLGKDRARPPMTVDDFIRGVRSTNGGDTIGKEMLRELYENIKSQGIEWNGDNALKKSEDNASSSFLFLKECESYLSEAQAAVRSLTSQKLLFQRCSSKSIVSGIALHFKEVFYTTFLAMVSSHISNELLANCVDGLRYASCLYFLIGNSNEAIRYVKLLARISYTNGFQGSNEQLHRDIANETYLMQDWFAELDLERDSSKRLAKKVNRAARDIKNRVLYERDKKILLEIQEQIAGDVVIGITLLILKHLGNH